MATLSSSHPGDDALSRFAPIAFAILQILTPVLPFLGVGEPIAQASDDVRTLITPAPWAFSIWGALYTGAIVFAIYQALPAQRNNALLKQIRWPAAGAFFGNAMWALYTQLFGLSFISSLIILFTLGCLLTTYRSFSQWNHRFSKSERWCAVLPLSALASWLTAATIVNIAASLTFHGVDAGDTGSLISAAMVIIGGAIVCVALVQGRGNPPYALVFLWALSGIWAAGGQRAGEVAVAVFVAALLVIAGMVVGLRRGGTGRWLR